MLFAFTLSLAAGLSTALGGLVILFCKKIGSKLMGFSLGFAAGVMITVSLADMLPHCVHTYAESVPVQKAGFFTASLIVCGMIIAFLLEKCIPEEKELAANKIDAARASALRSAIVTTVAIVLHNLPEGILTLFTSYASPSLGIGMALAIAMHNIPEGIAIAVPVYYATQSKGKAFLYTFLSGIAEPFGAVLAFYVLKGFITAAFLNGLVAIIAGIMCFVSISELIPESLSYGKRGYSVLGISVGIVAMSIGIYLI